MKKVLAFTTILILLALACVSPAPLGSLPGSTPPEPTSTRRLQTPASPQTAVAPRGDDAQIPLCRLTETLAEHPQGSPFVRGEELFWGWDPSVLHDDDGAYKVWYTLWANRTLGIAYAESKDGLRWEPPSEAMPVHALTPTAGAWDAKGLETVSVLKKDGRYMLWYLGYPCSRPAGEHGRHKCIGLATSADGISWEKYPAPVLTPAEAWEQPYAITEINQATGQEFTVWDGGVQEPSVLWDESRTQTTRSSRTGITRQRAS